MTPEHFASLKDDFLAQRATKETLFAQDLFGGSQPEYRVKVRVVTAYAWHSHFIRTLLVRPEQAELAGIVPEFTLIHLPIFQADPERPGRPGDRVLEVAFTSNLIPICGTHQYRAMQKSGFSIHNNTP